MAGPIVKPVYIAEADAHLWERAVALAERNAQRKAGPVSYSAVVVEALKAYLAEPATK